MQRSPLNIIGPVALTTALSGATTAAQASADVTIGAMTLNNVTANPVAVDVHIVPAAGTAGPTNQIATGIVIPAAGSAPTICSFAVGHHIPRGGTLQMKAATASAITAIVSGYLTTP